MPGIAVGDRWIGSEHRPFIIAEMSGNHNQSLDRALDIVTAAAGAGVQALKIQTYTADTMTLDVDGDGFTIADSSSLWNGATLYKLYQEAHTPWEWHRAIFDRCRECGILGFSTPFDAGAVDFLESLNVPAYKVASFENTDLPLIRRIATTGKPLIISTGMASLAELDETIQAAREGGAQDIVLLKCTSSYPASPLDSHIRTVPHLRELYSVEVGLSDHTLGLGVAVAAVALGATVIEKHFTLDRSSGGIDAQFSLEPKEMRALVEETERAWLSLGQVRYGPTEKEKRSLQFRRTLYVVKDLSAGDTLTETNVRAIRPGFGLPPKFYDVCLGRTVNRDIKRGTPLSWDLIG